MRRALIVGIDDYPGSPLAGCVNDANAIHELLRVHEDGSPNFSCVKLIVPSDTLTRAVLRQNIQKLFQDEADLALLYFSGHGTESQRGGLLVTPDAKEHDEGVPMTEVLDLANKSKVKEAIIVLDCCFSGSLGSIPPINEAMSVLREGVSILAASRATQTAAEAAGAGVFTSLLCSALDGGAADVIGNVTVASMYTYVDESLGAWDQRPLLKSHVARLTSVRKCAPAVPPEVLRRLPVWFPTVDFEYPLDPSYEPDAEPQDEQHQEIFGYLQRCRAAKLVVPVGEEHMYFAAMKSKSCKLTALGGHYWRLAKENRL